MKAIIFDIGNVLVKVDLSLWKTSFSEIGIALPENFLEDQELHQLVHEHGIGKISTQQLFQSLVKKAKTDKISLEQFAKAWNAVILFFYTDSLKTVELLRKEGYQVYVLSDTNEMHIAYLEELYQKLYPNKQFLALFDKSYLSHLTGYGKNQDEAWLQILKEHHLKPQDCFFIDDLSSNIKRAQNLGLHTFHYTAESNMQAVLKQIAALNQKSI